MNLDRLESFQRELAETGAYETKASVCARARTRPNWWTTLRFSLSVVRVFPLCAIWEAMRKLTTHLWAQFCFSAVTMPESCGMKVSLAGWKNRGAVKGPVVFVCNHMSTLETILLPPAILAFGPFKVVTKASLAHLPFLERAAAHMGVVPIGRVSPREDLATIFREGTKYISEGFSFLIFPQGTRQDVFSRGRFSSIGAKLAEKAGVPLVPIAVDTRCMPTRKNGFLKRFFKDFGPVDTSVDVRCTCGPAIPCGKAREMHERSFDWIASQLEAWGLPTERERILKQDVPTTTKEREKAQ